MFISMHPINVFVIALLMRIHNSAGSSYEITVDVRNPTGKLKHFWRSTGFCPPLPHTQADQYDLSRDQELNMAYVGSVPHWGIQQVRIHWMLELISAHIDQGDPHYDFTKLDQLIDLLWINGLRPGFELMGSVNNYFTNFEDKRQVVEWRNLVYLTAKRYIEKYGLESVSQWNFETWNEPNNHDFDNVTVSIQGFLNYYDACSEGLLAASSALRFGGPGDSCHTPPHSPYCWAMLQHCYNGTNFFTGKTGVRLDYIALHKKVGMGLLCIQPSLSFTDILTHPRYSLPIMEQEIQTMREIQERFPLFQTLQTWRADVTYAAMVVKVISQHQNLLLSDQNNTINYTLLSNDNAFLSYHPHPFTQRTLTARFQVNNTQPPHVQLLRKPVLTVMGLLTLLGETQVLADVVTFGENDNSTVGVLASTHDPLMSWTSDSWQATVLIYNSHDNCSSTATDLIRVSLNGFPQRNGLVYVTYYLDNNVTNPYQLWQSMGSPDYPSAEQFRQLRNMEDPLVDGPLPFPTEGVLTLQAKLSVPSVLLIHVCAQPKAIPDQVNGLRFISITKGQVLVVWKDHCVNSKCIKTFEVEFSKDQKKFHRVNTWDTIFTSYVYSPENLDVSGIYRVRAVDYWGRPGEYSLTEKYSEN
uniref:Alpha-L-iduronidase n=1 Tax=Esox lucius TaxID=8010 RepID=A0A6Q2Z2E0_ESOLU